MATKPIFLALCLSLFRRSNRFASLYAVVCASVVSLVSTNTFANNYVCPSGAGPNEIQVGVNNGMPICMSTGGNSGGAKREPRNPYILFEPTPKRNASVPVNDPIRIELVKKLMQLEAAAKKEVNVAAQKEELMNDPKYKRYKAGFWDFERTNGANGECSATFVNLDGAITIAGPIGDQGNAAVMFWGGSIPRPVQAGMKEATLNQTGQSPATVKTQHYAVDGSELGALAFAIPDPRVLVDGILDVQNFAVSLAGQKVFDGGWSDGLQARKKMAACFAKLGK